MLALKRNRQETALVSPEEDPHRDGRRPRVTLGAGYAGTQRSQTNLLWAVAGFIDSGTGLA